MSLVAPTCSGPSKRISISPSGRTSRAGSTASELCAAGPRRMSFSKSRTEHTRSRMLFMVIERFKDSDMVPVYRRLREKGRMLPDGLKYIDSWIEPNFSRCFQVMECDDLRRLQEWILQ